MSEVICKSGKCFDYNTVENELYNVFSGHDLKSKIEFDLLRYNL
jgi:hypothetical protein